MPDKGLAKFVANWLALPYKFKLLVRLESVPVTVVPIPARLIFPALAQAPVTCVPNLLALVINAPTSPVMRFFKSTDTRVKSRLAKFPRLPSPAVRLLIAPDPMVDRLNICVVNACEVDNKFDMLPLDAD